MTFDIVIILLLILFIWAGHRRGLLLTAVGFIGSLISIALAFVLVRPFSALLRKWGLFGDRLEALSDGIYDAAGSYPGAVASFLEKLGMPETWSRKLLQTSASTGSGVVDSAVNSVWQLVLSALALIFIYLVVRVALGFAARLLTPVVNGIPIVGWLNRLGGVLVGIVWALFTVWILVMVLTSLQMVSPAIRAFVADSRILAFLSEKAIFRSLLDTIF
ncbi:MAG: CvpA family protein [Saccharofermentanales bacterium]